jgi:hypothetical protein
MPTPTAEELALGVHFIPVGELAEGQTIWHFGEGHRIDHFAVEGGPEPDPERYPRCRIAVSRDGWELTLRAAYVPVLARRGA